MTSEGVGTNGRGLPIALIALMVVAWVSARVFIWDNPLAYPASAMASEDGGIGLGSSPGLTSEQLAASADQTVRAPQSIAYPQAYGLPGGAGNYPSPLAYGAYPYPRVPVYYAYPPHYGPQAVPGQGGPRQRIAHTPRAYAPPPPAYYPAYAGGPYPQGAYPPHPAYQGYTPITGGNFALAPALLSTSPRFQGLDVSRTGQVSRPLDGAGLPINTPPQTDRWFLDAFAFQRQGSSALSVPQGRLPIYGASQIAANLQWRAKPSSSHDPRVYIRAYRAMVEGGESEIAAGLSARPLGKVPVRLYGELRATQSPAVSELGLGVRTQFRPAAYAVTEFPPLKLPMGFALETYGAGGYVAGSPSTYFLDAQAVAARDLIRIGKKGGDGVGISVGGGVWGGAQRDAKRLDIGPTLRFDVDIGKLPARVSVDYREQVAGDAAPDSGVAATVSTRF